MIFAVAIAGIPVFADFGVFGKVGLLLLFAEQIALVQDDKIAEFNLVYNQGGNFFLRKVVLVGEVVPLFFFIVLLCCFSELV